MALPVTEASGRNPSGGRAESTPASRAKHGQKRPSSPAPPIEIELKLAIPAARADAVRALMTQTGRPCSRQDLETHYMDTPDFALSKQGRSVRLRRSGSIWIQSIKSDGLRRGGLSSRPEWEVAVPRGELRWELFPKAARKHIPRSLRAHCQRVFTTHVDRTSWLVTTHEGDEIEVALDIGTIEVDGRHEPVCEIELELKAGTAKGLAVWVRQHLKTIPFWPLDDSKGARGVRLAQGKPPSDAALDRRCLAVDLNADMPLAQAWVTVGRACLAHFQASLAGWYLMAKDESTPSSPTPSSPTPSSPAQRPKPQMADDLRGEMIHQARVALRRLRGAMRLFRDHQTIDLGLEQTWRAMAQALGAARDWDVLCDQTMPPMGAACDDAAAWGLLAAWVETRRAAARAELRRTLDELMAGAWVLAMHQTLNQQEQEAAAVQPKKGNPPCLDDWIQRVLHRGHRKISRGIRHWSQLTSVDRHALRLAIKRQRYAVEFFQSRLPARRTRRYLAALVEAQDVLGQANDLTVARSMLPRLTYGVGRHRVAVQAATAFAHGWLAAKTQEEPIKLKPKTKKHLSASFLSI